MYVEQVKSTEESFRRKPRHARTLEVLVVRPYWRFEANCESQEDQHHPGRVARCVSALPESRRRR